MSNEAGVAKNPHADLERFLCGDLNSMPSPEVLQARRLEAWAYTILPSGHPNKQACKSAFMGARARHELIKSEVLEVVRAWNAAGITPLLYKGFALAEWTYAHPGARFHGDVDVLVQPTDFRRALEVGHELGWETPQVLDHWLFDNPDPHELSLKRHGASTAFDVHQRLVPTNSPWTTREHALTQAAWANSKRIEWQGTQIRVLSPEDAFVFGLVISRCWSGDDWRLKSHDLLDGLALVRQGLSREGLLARAKALSVLRTLNSFLERCDPFRPTLNLMPPSNLDYILFELNSASEHTPPLFVRAIRLLLSLPAIAQTLMALPVWFQVRDALRKHPNLEQALISLEKRTLARNTRAIRYTSFVWWLVRRFKQTSSLTWPVLIYTVLYHRGEALKLRIGERKGVRYGWVEVDGKTIPEFYLEHGPSEQFEIVFEHGGIDRSKQVQTTIT
jgi:Uncharacterised nucleotidyltransferase